MAVRKRREETSIDGKRPPRLGQGRCSRFRWMTYADGSVRAVRLGRREDSFIGQVRADFFGIGDDLSVKANIRSMESLLAEIAEGLDWNEESPAPEVLADIWLKAVGDFLAEQSELVSVSRRSARIRTRHPAVRFELNRLKPQLLSRLNRLLGEGSVERICVIHG